ncbi:MAG: transposase [Acetobacter fabarum]|uniref:transposase n=1 Tax=Acetobacter fabarum TaxID=483199 RepID=UPI0039ED9BE2
MVTGFHRLLRLPHLRRLGRKHFPRAIAVVDKFHVVKMANEAVKMIRRSINAELSPADRVRLKGERKLLLSAKALLKFGPPRRAREVRHYKFCFFPGRPSPFGVNGEVLDYGVGIDDLVEVLRQGKF